MDKQKKIWLCEQYAHRVWSLSTCIAAEAARAGSHGEGYAVVAAETRKMAEKITKYIELLKFESDDDDKLKGIDDCAVMLNLLAVNAEIEAAQMSKSNMEFNIPKSMAVFSNELLNLAKEFNELSDNSAERKPYVLPEVAAPISSSDDYGIFLQFFIGGIPLVENLFKIKEIVLWKYFGDGSKHLRGEKISILDCYKALGPENPENELQPAIIMYGGRKNDELYAVPIDALDIAAIFYSKIGLAVPPEKDHKLARYARECWDAVGGGQLVFVDWDKLKG
jgi:chemotaxis signal transduction protein